MTTSDRLPTGLPPRPGLRRSAGRNHLWGAYEVRPVGRGLTGDVHLLVHPPGTDARERRWLRLLRDWPVGGAFAVAVLMVLLSWTPGVVSLGTAALVYTLGWVVVLAATRRTRPLVRHLRTSTFLGEDRPVVVGDTELQRVTYAYLCELETALRTGSISPVEFEQGWGEAWRALPDHEARCTDQAPTIGNA